MMGQRVRFNTYLERSSEERDGKTFRFWEEMRFGEEQFGWVVGLRTLQNGWYVPAHYGYGGSWAGEPTEEFDQARLAIEETVPVYLVARTPYTKPIPVLRGKVAPA